MGRELFEAHISEVFESVTKKNPRSRHVWTERGKLVGYKVSGCLLTSTFHKSLARAEKEKADRENYAAKYPSIPLYSVRERERVARYGCELPELRTCECGYHYVFIQGRNCPKCGKDVSFSVLSREGDLIVNEE